MDIGVKLTARANREASILLKIVQYNYKNRCEREGKKQELDGKKDDGKVQGD